MWFEGWGGRHGGVVGTKRKSFLFEGHQASKKETKLKMVKWQPHGLKITWWMIKYPHIKKNAHILKTHVYQIDNFL